MALTLSSHKLDVGTSAPEFELLGIDGKYHQRTDFQGKPILIIFICNHCPYVIQKTKEIVRLHHLFRKHVHIIAINSNDSKQYPDDSFERMKTFAKEYGIKFPYLHDESQEVARAYGAACTPDPFLFDENHMLLYHGRIDDQLHLGETVHEHTMEEVIRCMLEGKNPPEDFAPSMGCSIKWKN